MSPLKLLIAGFVLAASMVTTSPTELHAVTAHPYHVSLCEIEWNSKSGNFEVSLCVWPADLEKAIRRKTEGFSLDQPARAKEGDNSLSARDKEIEAYVNSRLGVINVAAASSPSSAKQLETRWVGCDIGLKEAWIYFEIKPSAKQKTLNGKDWHIENRLFFELNDDQLNQVNFKNGQFLKHITLTADHPNGTLGK